MTHLSQLVIHTLFHKNHQLPEWIHILLIKFHYLHKKKPISHQCRLGKTLLRLTIDPNCSSLLGPQLSHILLLMTFHYPCLVESI